MSSARVPNPKPRLPTAREAQLAQVGGPVLAALIDKRLSVRLRAIDSEIEVPVPALRMLVDILAQMAQGNAVNIVPIRAELTTQQAADLLNVSRPFLIGLLDRGELQFRKVGSHRRVASGDLVAYQKASDDSSAKAANELTALSQRIGLYK